MNRSALGVLSLVLLVVGAFQMATATGDGSLGGVFVRASLVLGAVWLVLPNARRVPRAVWAGISAFAAVLILVPRLVIWGVALAAVISAMGFLMARRTTGEPPR